MSRLTSIMMILMLWAVLWIQPHNSQAGMITILSDLTSSYAQTTYFDGSVDNPGTTKNQYSGPLFISGSFAAYHLDGSRETFYYEDGVADRYKNSAFSSFSKGSGDYWFHSVYLDLGIPPTGGVIAGSSAAETMMDLQFLVSGSDAKIDLFAENMGANAWIKLYDETTSSLIASLSPTNADGITDLELLDSHIYTLSGYLYCEDHFSGDPNGRLGFRFQDSTIISNVPEPSASGLFFGGLLMMIFIAQIRKRVIVDLVTP